jgi:probable F420-dependent oxidoreductase
VQLGVQVASGDFAKVKDLAQAAEGLGFATVYFPDHFVYETGLGAFNATQPVYEAATTLAALAMATARVRIGTHVLCNPFRHPALTAKIFATLDHVSGGRLIAGMGAGWTRVEFEMMGLPFPDVPTRLAMLDEALQVMRALWTEERASFDGRFYTLRDAVAAPKPLQHPHPPLMVGGNGKGIMRLAARYADIVNVAQDLGRPGTVDPTQVARFTREALRARIAFLRTESEACGRPMPRLYCTAFVITITESPSATRTAAENFGRVLGVAPETLLRMPSVLIGTPEEAVAELRRREREDGLVELTVGIPNMKIVRRLGEDVLPHVRSAIEAIV